MIYFILGIIVGIMLAISAIALGRKNERVIENIIERATEKLEGKAEIVEPTSSEVEAMEEVFKENKERGKVTELKDL